MSRVPDLDIDRTVPCPACGKPLQVWLPILVTPGDGSCDVDLIDWEAANREEAWVCAECDGFDGFPESYVQPTEDECE